ncbi:MAG: hypothetical protein ACYTBZ_10350 [Planctomycetota bacterium]
MPDFKDIWLKIFVIFGLVMCVRSVGHAQVPDCNGNGIADACDIDCGPSGGACDVPGCGASPDCNSNGVPDECDLLPESSETKLIASDGAEDDRFGDSVSIDGEVAIIGAPEDGDKNTGSAYVLRWNGASWVEEVKLTASDAEQYDHFGGSVSISGDVALVGLPWDDHGGVRSGSVYVFRRNGSSWVETNLTASDAEEDDRFGHSVSISGDVAMVGAYGDDDRGGVSGSVYVFRWNGSSWIEESKLTASDGAAGDRFGTSVSLDGEVALIGASDDSVGDVRSGSAYVFRWNGSSWVEEDKLTASDGANYDNFGYSVSIDGEVALIGAPYDNDRESSAGSAYVFRRHGSSWVQEDELSSYYVDEYDYFGESVSISGGVAVIGAPYDDENGNSSGVAYVFRWNPSIPGSWIEEERMVASDNAAKDYFGKSVSLSGKVALIGSPNNDGGAVDSGSAYMYRVREADCNQNGIPDSCDIAGGTSDDCNANSVPDECELTPRSMETRLNASDFADDDFFGDSVSIDGDVALVGASYEDDGGDGSGSVYVYRWNGSIWVEDDKLTASDAEDNDRFGNSVSIDGNVALIGSPYDDDGGDSSGSAYVFRYNGSSWVQEDKLTASDAAAGDMFGWSVSISGEVALIGAFRDDNVGDDSGSAYVFRFNGTSWVEEKKLTASDTAKYDEFGYSVSIDGNVALIGSPYNDHGAHNSPGAAYVFRWDGASWVETKLTASDAADWDHFGNSVSIDGGAAMIGAPGDGDGYCNDCGAAYAFGWNGSNWVEKDKLTASDGRRNGYFGTTVSLDGDLALIGGDFGYRSDWGAGYVFRWFPGSVGSWVEQTKLTGTGITNRSGFGRALSLSGNVALIGALSDDAVGDNTGSAYVFHLLEADCNRNDILDGCDITGGTSQDCNMNLVPDECDIPLGYSSDCDNDGHPDDCQADTDNDGVIDPCDNCPISVNAGQTDSDADGTGDACDNCPTDTNKINPGACGCGVPDDSNGDGVIDCLVSDHCPNDPNKTSPGTCGCGVPDDDNNGDGVPDCLSIDLCPNDPAKTNPGACGCGVSDADNNGDGAPDCFGIDLCPNDPIKTNPGICGCGIFDIDSNGDGIIDCLGGSGTGGQGASVVTLRVKMLVGDDSSDGGIYTFLRGESVPVSIPDDGRSGYCFSHWMGDVNGTDTNINVYMDRDKTITAVYYQCSKQPLVCGAGAAVSSLAIMLGLGLVKLRYRRRG